MAGKWRHKALRSIEIWVNGSKLACDAHGNISGELTEDALFAMRKSADFELVEATPGDDAGGAPATPAEASSEETEKPSEEAAAADKKPAKKKATKKKSSKKKK